MTLLVALVSETGGVIASDGFRFSADGTLLSDQCQRKAFRCGWALCGLAGQLVPDGRELHDIILQVAARFSSGDLGPLVKAVEEEANAALNRSVVPLMERVSDIVLVGTDRGKMRIAHIRSEPDEKALRVDSRCRWAEIGHYLNAGDTEAAQAAKDHIMRRERPVNKWSVARLDEFATAAVRAGIRGTGMHPKRKEQPACGGVVRCVRVVL